MAAIPLGIRLLPSVRINRNVSYRIFILVFTFMCYASYHLSRKVISVVKSVLHQNCTGLNHENISIDNNSTWCDWAPFDVSNANALLGYLDVAFLFAYAVGMFLSGHIAERMSLRKFLAVGMVMSGFLCALFGLGYFWKVHSLAFYFGVQTASGLFQSTGWPAVVTCIGNWYGKGRRGLIMGIWNSHTSVGNILGSIIPAIFVKTAWGWSFIVPGLIIGLLGVLVFFFLVPHPADVGCEVPNHQGKEESKIINQYSHSAVDFGGYETVQPSDDPKQPLMDNSTSGSEDDMMEVKHEAISLFRALRIPGVIEFSLCLFFAKLVSYTFLFWLPKYIDKTTSYGATESADLSTLFDVGGIIGGILAGVISDNSGARATTCFFMLAAAAPMLYVYNVYATVSFAANVGLLMSCGLLVNGPYSLITTAVSADLGTHESLQGNSRALATVTAIIDGTGSIGAALGPLLTGVIAGANGNHWKDVFYMLISANIFAMILLSRLVFKEFKSFKCCQRTSVVPHSNTNS